MTKKIKKLLQTQNNPISTLFLKNLDKLNVDQKRALYFVLTTPDQEKLAEFAKEQEVSLKKLSNELKIIEAKSKKLAREVKEKKEQVMELKEANTLLNNLK